MAKSLVRQPEILIGKPRGELKEFLGELSKEGRDIVSYEVRFGDIFEKMLPSRFYIVVELDPATDTVKRLMLADA